MLKLSKAHFLMLRSEIFLGVPRFESRTSWCEVRTLPPPPTAIRFIIKKILEILGFMIGSVRGRGFESCKPKIYRLICSVLPHSRN